MANWHEEVLRDEGWLDYIFNDEEEKLAHVKIEGSRSIHCKICGTRTGLHGFSFDEDNLSG